jgi:hemoglobin
VADSIFTAIGGKSTILAAVNSFYRRVLADENLSPFFNHVDTETLEARQSMFLTMLLGGRVLDSSDQIRSAHNGTRAAGLNDFHFDLFLAHFRAALEESGVPHDSVLKIMELLESKRDAVLNRNR